MRLRIYPDKIVGYNVQQRVWWWWETVCWAPTVSAAEEKVAVLERRAAA